MGGRRHASWQSECRRVRGCGAGIDIPEIHLHDVDPNQYLTGIKIFAHNRQGLLMEISKIFTESKIDINAINTHTSKQGIATLELSFVVGTRDELAHVTEKLRQIPSVIDIERTAG